MQRMVLAAIAAAMVVAVAPEANGKAGELITFCGDNVSTNAVLAQDLSCAGDGIIVAAHGIKIDLNGHTLTGDGGVNDYGLDNSGGFDKVTVKNGVVRNFGTGVRANGAADQFTITNVVASGNTAGFDISGDLASISSSTASSNNGRGIQVSGDKAPVKSATATGNGESGIGVSSDAAKITGLTASGNAEFGLILGGTSASLKSSSLSGNGFSGILISGDQAHVSGNRADANGFDGFMFPFPAIAGSGIVAIGTGAVGKNSARGNENPGECMPASLC